jgi:3-dehydroquinate dehydratase-2
MAGRILILNGPNLNMLGRREPEIYGTDTLADVEKRCRALLDGTSFELDLKQSNHEGELVEWIQQAIETHQAIIINPAAYSHSSIAILDALKMFTGPVLEVHISNIHHREAFRHHSYVTARADGVMAGFGMQGYELAVQRVLRLLG